MIIENQLSNPEIIHSQSEDWEMILHQVMMGSPGSPGSSYDDTVIVERIEDLEESEHDHTNKNLLDSLNQQMLDGWGSKLEPKFAIQLPMPSEQTLNKLYLIPTSDTTKFKGYVTKASTIEGVTTYAFVELSGGSSTSDYTNLSDKPSIEGVTLSGNKTAAQLGLMKSSDVSDWAKAANKPSYTAQEVGALPSNTNIPTKTSDLTNDSGFLTGHQSLQAYRTATEQSALDATKVDKVQGKDLSTNDYTDEDKSKVASAVQPAALDNYVEKVQGKGLSTEDYTASEKTKLAGLSNYDDTALTSRVSAIEGKESGWNAKAEKLLVTFTRNDTVTVTSDTTYATIKAAANAGKIILGHLNDNIDDINVAMSFNGVHSVGEVSECVKFCGFISGVLYEITGNSLSFEFLSRVFYTKPVSGIPSSDLSSAVQTSLGKADSALQSHQSLDAYRTSAAQDVIDATKASKASNPTAGHIATLDSNGNPTDGGKTIADLTDIIYGYMHNGTFYLTRTGSAGAYVYSDAVTPETDMQYTDKEGNVPYIWDGAAYQPIGGGSTPQSEAVSFNITSSDGQATLTGAQIIVNVSGVASPTIVTLDANGQGSTSVSIGTPYSIVYPSIAGYTKPADAEYIAMTSSRSIIRSYNKIELLNLTSQVHVEESSNPLWTLGGNPQIVDNILGIYGSYVIDEINKKYARLSPADHSKFLDGTAWTGTYGNSFRRFPRVYYKFDTTTKILYISDSLFDADAKHWDETWIGTYKGSVQSNVLRSIPDVTTAGNMNMYDFWMAAQRNSGDYGLVNYFDHCLLNALHLCKYGNANSQQTMGGGLQDAGTNYFLHTTGTTKGLGDATGSSQYLSTNFTMCKLFGIEDLAGSQWEFRPNIRFSGTDAIVYEGNIVSNTDPGIRTFTRCASLNSQYIKEMALGENFDLIPITGGGTASTYWCDGAWDASVGQLLRVGGPSNNGSICGLSATSSDSALSHSHTSIGARLAFKGAISEYELVTGAQLAALH